MTIAGFFTGTGMPDADWWEALWPQPATVLAAVGVQPMMNVVDLCSGDGLFTAEIAKIARSVVAIDIDPELLRATEQRLSANGLTNTTFVEGDAYDIAGLVNGPVDHVFLANVFHGVADRLRLSQTVRSVLKPGGLFAIVNWHARSREETTVLGSPRGPASDLRITPQETIAAVEPSGLMLRDVTEVGPYHYAAVFRRKA
jgi:ubiquinone/menaquinone biosynthesis C-methylase UbiE